jgi:hypothetical protein
MPATTYMVVDPRRDHSFRIPRPDLSTTLGTPNACNQCHQDQTAKWAAEQVAQRKGPDYTPRSHYGEVFSLARAGDPRSLSGLLAILADESQPDIVRATAVEFLRPVDPQQFQAIR